MPKHDAFEARRRALRLLDTISRHQPVTRLLLADESWVQGRLASADSRLSELLLHELRVPLGTLAHAVVRGADVDVIECPMDVRQLRGACDASERDDSRVESRIG